MLQRTKKLFAEISSKGVPRIMGSLNVFNRPLALHSTQPLTGFTRSGYCEVPSSDFGNHAVAAVVTNEFLDFSASRGNDLRQAGLTDGCKWCLCASRWKEAFAARRGDEDRVVPKVYLSATNKAALRSLELDDLKKFALDRDAATGVNNAKEL